MNRVPQSVRTLVERFDPDAFDVAAGSARIRLEVTGRGSWDFEIRGDRHRLRPGDGSEPDAELIAATGTWKRIAADLPGAMSAYRSGALRIRRNLHLGVGFLAATGGDRSAGRLRFETVDTPLGRVATMQAGTGEPLVMLHGLGATKAEFMPTLAALAPKGFRMIAIDLPGFGDSDKPFPAAYDAPFFARWMTAALDALELDRAHLLGHSMGGRVALELGMRNPDRMRSLVLMTPSMAWLAERRWAAWLRLVRPELGIFQPAPRAIVEGIVKRVVPGASSHFVAPALDEFLRSYLTPRGRVAFYAAARQIYLEDPEDFWAGLRQLSPDSLFIWGQRDTLVPIGFQRHVRESLPAARHVVLDCGHVPQLECPGKLHGAIERFLLHGSAGVGARPSRVAPARGAGAAAS